MSHFFPPYFERIASCLRMADAASMESFAFLLEEAARHGNRVFVAGNGGSAAIAAHVAVDLTKNGGVRAMTFNEADLITCFANDFGYEKWLAKAIEYYGSAGDIAVLVSSSGQSPNMVNAATKATELGMKLVTFTGFRADNPLRRLGGLNFWVDSNRYNDVEMTHLAWLLAVADRVIERRNS